ncbi:MAG TPA: ABC-type transport auxiliary lipoprotein family protein [Stellaceae bacterium]|jgi:cholesterol transport system auxiliary component|nr:ABC-type transport auxiliary lipoprotein family protein [Stellaceae bacterium]
MIRNFCPLRHRASRLALTALVVVALAGCASMFTKDPRPLFQLSAPSDFPGNLPHTNAQIVVDAPYAPEGLELRRIAVVRASNAIDYLADGDWADRTPNMVRAVLVEAFENSKSVAAVGPDSLDLRADFEIEGDLRHFEADYDSPAGGAGAPTATVALAVKLVKVPERKILAQTMISAQQRATSNTTPAIVQAMNDAMGNVAKQVVAWTLTNPALSTSRR